MPQVAAHLCRYGEYSRRRDDCQQGAIQHAKAAFQVFYRNIATQYGDIARRDILDWAGRRSLQAQGTLLASSLYRIAECNRGNELKGIIFNVLEDVVSANYGETVWDDLLDAAGSDGVYTSLGSYPDEQMMQLVAAAAEALDLSTTDVVRWFGRQAMPRFAQRFPEFFTTYSSTRPFVLALNTIIHPEVRKLYTGAYCPTFDFSDAADGALLIGYDSPRKLCALAHGFMEGVADHYQETVEVDHLQCMHRGDPKCMMRMTVH